MRPLSLLVYASASAKRLLSLNLRPHGKRKTAKNRGAAQAYLQRDVHSKRFENPYQRQPRFVRLRDAFITYRFRIGFSALVLALGLWIYVLFFTNNFYVRAVTVTGTQEIPNADVVAMINKHFNERAWLIFPRRHLFFLGLDALEQQIHAKYHLSSLHFRRVWSSQRFEASLEEKPSVFVYSVDTKFFSLDREGIVIRELPQQPENIAVPVIYQYDSSAQPQVGQAVLNAQAIDAIERLYSGLQSYPSFQVQSFRIRVSPQRQITIVEKTPEPEKKPEPTDPNAPALAKAAESIANAKTESERVASLKQALQDISVEKLEEKTIDDLLKEERVYQPDPQYQFQELEIAMKQGWSLKAGHTILQNADEANRILNIFATLNQQINISGEVKEYIDLRFGNRVYYR